MRLRRTGLPLSILLAAFLLTRPLLAGPTATLSGRVTDPGGGVIAGVKVEATNIETNVIFSGETNAEGLYTIANLPPATYRVIVQKFAFKTIVKPDVELHVQDVIALNFSMEVGSVVESITVEGGAPLIQAGPQRGGNFLSHEVRDLPLVGLNPLSLAATLPGAVQPAGSFMWGKGGEGTQFSVNGQRPRGNNFLLDSTENNDIAFTGVAQPFNIADAVEEVSVQTGNFGVEFGRAGGGVFNVVTKSGTNSLHGTLLSRYQSQRFNSVSNLDKMNRTPQSVFSRNVYGFTLGGPVRKNKTFFFGGFQQDTLRSTRNFPLVLPTEAAVGTLRSLFPSNPRLDLYLGLLGDLRGSASPIGLQLGDDPRTGVGRGVVQFASAPLGLPASNEGPQWLGRLDHNLSEAHRLALRYIYDSRTNSPINILFPGFILDQAARNQNLLVTDHYTFSPTWTNEFRFSYARQKADDPQRISPQSVPLARTLPRFDITSIDSPGAGAASQSRLANNLLFQETQTKLSGRHTFRYGVEFLRQLAIQFPAANSQGILTYTNAAGYSAFANFLDDFSGPTGRARRTFGATVFHPDQFRQVYFFQDTWLPAPSLSLTLGLRYEKFGQPANSLRFPAFSGFNPDDFLKPNRVNTDNNNFGPAFGLAWSPSVRSGWLGRLLGEGKTVWRGGYQISYDAFFTQIVSQLLASATPNSITTDISAPGTGRGSPNWFAQLPVAASAPSILLGQIGALEKDLRSPYTERWSFGFQRQLSSKLVLDGSYVGSESHKLTTWAEVNTRQPDGRNLHPDFGSRQIRTSQGNSAYHAMQWRLDRRFARGFQTTASYTWSRSIDSTSEGVGSAGAENSQNAARTSVPVALGGLRLDRGPSDYDRAHRLTVLYLWDVPSPARGFWRYALGGWKISGIASFQSGAPFTPQNGSDRNNDGQAGADRPDIGNPRAPLNSRAVLTPASGSQSCATGYRNPDTGVCVIPGDVHWVQGRGLPNASTVGRNTLVAGGINNFDLGLSKFFQIGEQRRLEFRWEALNALNHPQFTQVPERSVVGAPSSRFLNRDFTDSGIRSMWAQVKLVF
jgi:outer membrane receptor protein involved in Fe transport